MNVNVDMMAIRSLLPRDAKGKNACIVSWQRLMATASKEKTELVQRCWHLPPFWVVRGAICTCPQLGWSEVLHITVSPTSSCPNPIHQTSSAPAGPCWWSLVVSLSGKAFKMPANRNRALFINCERWILSSNSRCPNRLFKTGATCNSFVLEIIKPSYLWMMK